MNHDLPSQSVNKVYKPIRNGRRGVAILFLLLLACATMITLAPVAEASERSRQAPRASSPMEVLLHRINEHRANHGCAPLTIDPTGRLAQAAQGHAEDMAIRNYLSHVNPEGLGFADRITATGYRWSSANENIAVGLDNPERVTETWMQSPRHRVNLLDCSVTEAGVGMAFQADDQADVALPNGSVSGPFYHYWVLVLAAPAP